MGKNGLDNINNEAYKAAMQGAKDLIKADKDIISQIKVEYDESIDGTHIVFPKNILPIKFYCDAPQGSTIFCDFENFILVDSDGDTVGTITIGNQQITILIEGEITKDNIHDIMYLYFNNDDDGTYFNWYKILNPVSGTKLYKHSIDINSESINIISTKSTPYILSDFTSYVYMGKDCLTISETTNNNALVYGIYFDVSSNELSCIYVSSSFQIWVIENPTLTDTVTEL